MTAKTLATAALLGLGIGMAQAAVTVTFSGLIGPFGNAGDGTVYSEGGLTFNSGVLQHWGPADIENADFGGATLYHSEVDPALVVTRTGGGLFDLSSFALAEADNNASAINVTFRYTDGSGLHSSTLTVPAAAGLHTFVVNRPGISSFELADIDFQVDNIVYTAVPEPASYALLALGLLVIGVRARARHTRAQR